MTPALAEVCNMSGRPDEGLAAVAEALRILEQTGAIGFVADYYRIHGELLLKGDAVDETQVERSFRTAIEIARHQEAKWQELRATTDLARLLAKQGKSAEARVMLAGIYNWFAEGFDTADLKDAKALLDELGA